MTPLHTYPSISKLTDLSRYNLGSESTVAKKGKIPTLPESGVRVYNLGGLTLNYQSLLFTTYFLSSLGLGMGQYLAEVPRGASAVLQTQAHIVLCFAVAAVCGSLEVREGFGVVPCLHVLCPCRKRSTNTFPTVTFHILDQTLRSLISSQNPPFLLVQDRAVQHVLLQLAHWCQRHGGGGWRLVPGMGGCACLSDQ